MPMIRINLRKEHTTKLQLLTHIYRFMPSNSIASLKGGVIGTKADAERLNSFVGYVSVLTGREPVSFKINSFVSYPAHAVTMNCSNKYCL